jgi:WD40 repeat protein
MQHTMQRARRGCIASLVLMLGAALSGCGGGDEATKRSASGSSATSAGIQATAPVASVDKPQALRPGRPLRRYDKQGITAVAISPDGASLAVARADGKVRLLDSNSVADVSKFDIRIDAVASGIGFSNDGRLLGVVGRDSDVHVFSTASGSELHTLHGHEHPIRALARSPASALIATAGEETRVMLWNAAQGKLERILAGHTDFVNALAFSADGALLASGDAAGRILVWDIASGQLLHTLRGHASDVHDVAFRPDGKVLASASADSQVLLWDLVQGVRIRALAGHETPVRSVAFNRNGTVLASGGDGGQILVWNADTGQLDKHLTAGTAPVNALLFDSKDNNVLFSGSGDYRVVRWNVASGVGK